MATNEDKGEKRIHDRASDDPKVAEKARAKSEDETNAAKRKAEGDAAQWTSPEHKTLTGDDVYPEQKVVPSSPDPENDPEFQAMKRAREQKDATKP